MEIKDGSVIINIDEGIDDTEKDLIELIAFMIDFVVRSKRDDALLVVSSAVKMAVSYIEGVIEEAKEKHEKEER